MSSAIYAQEVEAIEAILSKANDLLHEFESREKTNAQHNTNMQSFITILEDMKTKLIIMIESFENDNLLSKLLVLNDGIDEVVRRINGRPTMKSDVQDGPSNTSHAPLDTETHFSFYNEFDVPLDIDRPQFGAQRKKAVHIDVNAQLPKPWIPTDMLLELEYGGELENVPNEMEPHRYLLSQADGASSSSSSSPHLKKRKDKKDKEVKKDKGKMPVNVCCKICDEEYDSWYLVHELSSCKHIYCIECLRQYYTQKIKDGSVLNITCPDPTCKAEVTPNDVRSVLDDKTWEKYDTFVLMSALKQDPNICWCPFPGCTSAIYREPTEDLKIVCDACRYQFCAECKEAWHEDMSCEEYASVKEKMEKSVAKQTSSFSMWTSKHNKQVKPCPGCKAFIEKFDGCNHMTCVSCKFQFCWMCLSEYTAIHFNDNVSFPNCYMKQYYTPRPWYRPHVEKETLVKAGKILGIGAAVMILGVPVAVIGGPIYGVIKLRQKLRPKKWVITNHGWELHNE